MHKVTCSFCGLPFSVRRPVDGADYFCCSGCALASRIPLGSGGQFPVSPGLIIALAFAFGLFNQVLFGALGAAVVEEGRADVGGRLQMVSVVIASGLVLTGVGFSIFSRGRAWGDAIVGGLVLLGGTWLGWVSWRFNPGLVVWPYLGVTLVLAGWLARGWVWRAVGVRRAGRAT
jgi:hypothetical protein